MSIIKINIYYLDHPDNWAQLPLSSAVIRLTKQQNTDHTPQTSLCAVAPLFTINMLTRQQSTAVFFFFACLMVLLFNATKTQSNKTLTMHHRPHFVALAPLFTVSMLTRQQMFTAVLSFLLLYCPKTLTVVLTLSSIPPITVITPTKQMNTDIKVETLNSREHTTYFKERQRRLLILRPFCSVCRAFHTHLGFVTVSQGRKRDGLTLSI